MRTVVTMWRKPRMVGLADLVAVFYAGLLLPFKEIQLVPGLTTLRPANFLPVVAGLLFGPAGAWGAAAGNVVGDVFGGTWNAVSPFGAVANFFGAYVSYRVWGGFGPLSTGSRPDLRSPDQLWEYIAVVVVSSAVISAILGWGMELTGTLPFAAFATLVFVSNSVVALALGPPVLYALYPRVESRGLLATQVLSESAPTPRRDGRFLAATLALSLVAVAWLVVGSAYSVVVDGAPLFGAPAELIGTHRGSVFQQTAGAIGFLAVVAFSSTDGRVPGSLPTPPADWTPPSVPPSLCLCAVGVALSSLFVADVFYTVRGTPNTALIALVTTLFGLGPILSTVGSTLYLRRNGYRPCAIWRIALWTVGGLAVVTFFFAIWEFYIEAALVGDPNWSATTLIASAQTGALGGFAVGLYDVRAEHRRRRAAETRERLELLNRVVRHDIRNRMQVVHGRTELLRERGETDHVETILDATETVIDLTETARDVTETTLHQDQDLEAVSLRTVLQSRVNRARAEYDAATIRIDGEIQPTDVLANEMLGSVIDNLVHNAIAHNDAIRPRVDISVDEGTDHVTVFVADNGPGIPNVEKPDVFDRGERGAESPGSGFGLYLARTLVDQYGGDLSVRDNDPRGSVFELELVRADQ